MQSTIPQTEIKNKRQKQVHIYYTNIPDSFVIYPNTTMKTYVSFGKTKNNFKNLYNDKIISLKIFYQHDPRWYSGYLGNI